MSGIAGFEMTLQPIATSSPCRVTRAWHLLYVKHRQLHRARRTRWDRRVGCVWRFPGSGHITGQKTARGRSRSLGGRRPAPKRNR